MKSIHIHLQQYQIRQISHCVVVNILDEIVTQKPERHCVNVVINS